MDISHLQSLLSEYSQNKQSQGEKRILEGKEESIDNSNQLCKKAELLQSYLELPEKEFRDDLLMLLFFGSRNNVQSVH